MIIKIMWAHLENHIQIKQKNVENLLKLHL